VHRRNTFWSVGDIEKTLGLLNTLRKEGFARVHRPRKEYFLRLLEGLKEKSLEGLNEHKECTKDKVSSSYKLGREERGVARESAREVHRRTGEK
jgi:hypothetical protein